MGTSLTGRSDSLTNVRRTSVDRRLSSDERTSIFGGTEIARTSEDLEFDYTPEGDVFRDLSGACARMAEAEVAEGQCIEDFDIAMAIARGEHPELCEEGAAMIGQDVVDMPLINVSGLAPKEEK